MTELTDSQTKRLMAGHGAERQAEQELVDRPGKEHDPIWMAVKAAEAEWPEGKLCPHGRAPGKHDPVKRWASSSSAA